MLQLSISMANSTEDNEITGKLATEYNEMVSNPEILRKCTIEFLNEVIDELSLGIIFDTHRKLKISNSVKPDEEFSPQRNNHQPEPKNKSKQVYCVCQVCNKVLAATKFAKHLAACLGFSDNTRIKNTRASSALGAKVKDDTDVQSDTSDNEKKDASWNGKNTPRRRTMTKNSNFRGNKRTRYIAKDDSAPTKDGCSGDNTTI